jgi:hypothetical protein
LNRWDAISVLILVAGASIFVDSVEIQEQKNWSLAIGLVLITFMVTNGYNSLREFMGERLNGSLICKKENLNCLTVQDARSLVTHFILRRGHIRVPFKIAQNQLSPLTFNKLLNKTVYTQVTQLPHIGESQFGGTIQLDTVPATSKGQL